MKFNVIFIIYCSIQTEIIYLYSITLREYVKLTHLQWVAHVGTQKGIQR